MRSSGGAAQLSGAGRRSVRPRGRGRARAPAGPRRPGADPLALGTGQGHRPLRRLPTPLGCCPLGGARSWGAAPGAKWPGLVAWPVRGASTLLCCAASWGCCRPDPGGRWASREATCPDEIARPLSVTICRGLSPRVQIGHEPGVMVTLVSGPSLRTGPGLRTGAGTLRRSPVCQQSVL